MADKCVPNDIKKGETIRLKDGREAIVQDNLRGPIRMVEVFLPLREKSSIYVWEWEAVKRKGGYLPITIPPEYKRRQEIIERCMP